MSDHDHRKAGEIAALQRFPAERQAIEALAATSEDFCDMCEDLADAEMALRAAKALPPGLRAERTAEWTASIDRLSADIARALRNANVISISRFESSRRRP